MTTLRETIEQDIKGLCHYFDWEENSEQADAIRNVLIATTALSADMSKDLILLKILSMRKEGIFEKEPVISALSTVVESTSSQDTVRTRPLQYVSVRDIHKLL